MDLRTGEPTVITRKRMTRKQKRTVLSNIALLMETEAPATEMPAAVPQMRKVGPCIPSTTSESAKRSLSLCDRMGTMLVGQTFRDALRALAIAKTPASHHAGTRNACNTISPPPPPPPPRPRSLPKSPLSSRQLHLARYHSRSLARISGQDQSCPRSTEGVG